MLRLTTLLLLSLVAPLTLAQAPEKYIEGQHYLLVQPAQPTANPAKIEVIESFSYGCIHCAHFQPTVDTWKKKMPADVQFTLLPAFFQPYFALMGRAYYAADALGVVAQTHNAMFKAVFDEKRKLTTIEEIAEFYKDYGVKPEDFVAAAKSFAVETKVKRADELTKRYGIDGTPEFVVNGKYRVGPRSAGGYDKIFDVVDFLIAKERAAKKA